MTIDQVIEKISEIGIIPVVRARSAKEAGLAIEAIREGGIPIVEITLTVPDAPFLIKEVVKRYGDMVLVGAGTVLTSEQADACLNAGAQFLVSPGLSIPVLQMAKAREKLVIPGALTPTEIMAASGYGAQLIKVFPCGNMGGAKYLKALRGPFPNLALIPTGGVNASNAADFIAAGAFALGVGSELIDAAELREGNSQKIVAAAKELVESVQSARQT
jgi:2-dehydro-3-deoxyphosphogluconate aldolase/(4S)-4-hydroxy-2-oxoglutarate aldolase